jgi:hypothetical protein
MIDLVNRQKIRADNYIVGFLAISYITFVVIFRLEWIMSVIVYPFIALFFHGLIKIISSVNKRNRGNNRNISGILFGFIVMIFSVAFLYFILSQPNVKAQNIVNLATFPIFIVGLAGIVKGIIIDIYSLKHRVVNIIIGIITYGVCIFAFISPGILPNSLFRLHFITLSLALLLNVLGRAALYLSEYGLSIFHFRNFKLFFYIISDYFIYIDSNGNAFLDKLLVKRNPIDDEPLMTLNEIKTQYFKFQGTLPLGH